MHRALNIKHRIVRRIDVGKAPLATFDTIDLGDGDPCLTVKRDCKKDTNRSDTTDTQRIKPRTFICQESLKSETIGGNNSKKSLSQGGGGKDEKKDEEAQSVAGDGNENPDETGNTTSKNVQPPVPHSPEKDGHKEKDRALLSGTTSTAVVAEGNKEEGDHDPRHNVVSNSSAGSSSGLIRQGTLGRVSIPIRKQDSVSSSSSSEACNDAHFTFSATRPSIAHLDSADAGPNLPDSAKDTDTVSNLVPEIIDPSQILSPSKRKAYEKRIERLKVTTSPIARPRSTAPISVVTLDEYANLSSPEASPASPSVLQDKLKITLPSDEFAVKPKTPKHLSAKKHDSEDTCFEFTEEILFRCTKSALVVEEDGHLPSSPRRVLIPPTITPATSPKLSESPRLGKDGGIEDVVLSTTPKLIYFKEDINAQTFFGKTVDQTENENWADFPDSRASFEKADSECLEKEVKKSSSYLSKELSLSDQGSAVSAVADVFVCNGRTDSIGSQLKSSGNINSPQSGSSPGFDSKLDGTVEDNQTATYLGSADRSIGVATSYNIKENSEDVLVVEIVEHESESEKLSDLTVIEQDSKQDLTKGDLPQEKKDSDVEDPAHSCAEDSTWAFFDTLSKSGEHVSDPLKDLAESHTLTDHSSIVLLDLKQTTAETETQAFPDANSLLDTFATSKGDSRVEPGPLLPQLPDPFTENSAVPSSKASGAFNQGLCLIDSSPIGQPFASTSPPFDQQTGELATGQLTLTPLVDLQASSPSDLISFSSSQDADDSVEEQ